MKRLSLSILLLASPAYAADGPFLSLFNTDLVVLISFCLFLGVLVYLGVPKLLMGLLDKRADTIKSELDEARALHDEAKALLASYQKKQAEVQAQAGRIVETAKEEAKAAAKQAKADIAESVARRLAAAEAKIASAEAAAVTEVRNQAITVAIAAAKEVIADNLSAAHSNALIDSAIKEAGTKLH